MICRRFPLDDVKRRLLSERMILIVILLAGGALMLSIATRPAGASEHGERGPDHHGKMFERADGDGDGVLSLEEMVAAREAHFDAMDTNGDGTVSKAEWQARIADMFAKADSDNSGTLTRSEMRAHHRQHRMPGRD